MSGGCPIFLHTRRQEFELMQALSALGKAQKLRSATIKTPGTRRARRMDQPGTGIGLAGDPVGSRDIALQKLYRQTLKQCLRPQNAALEGPAETSACGMKYVEMGELLRSVLVV